MLVNAPKPGGGIWARHPDACVGVALVVLTFVAHAASPVTTSTDSAWTFHVSASLLREGDIDLDEYRDLMDLDLDYRLRSIRGHIYSYYPAATPLLATPAVLAANLVLPMTRGENLFAYLQTHGPDDRTARLEKLTASVFVTLTGGLMFAVARRYIGRIGSAIAALTLVFATSMWSTASRALWQHAPSALFLLAALYVAIAFPRRPWSLLCGGMLLAFAYLIRPTNSLALGFFGLYYFLTSRRQLWAYALGGAIVLLPYGLINLNMYGNALPPYSYQLFERLGTPASIAEALAGTLLSPNRGLFVFSPVLAFAFYGIFSKMDPQLGMPRRLTGCILGILASHWLMTSLFIDWAGAWSIGPRYFVDLLPYFIFLLIPVFSSWFRWLTLPRYAFVIALLLSGFIQFRCATSPFPFLWNGKPRALVDAPERIWDAGDLQFLRGLCADDPLEGRAPACWLRPND